MSKKALEDLTIGELSRRTGVKITTIRYYESAGLLPAPPRTEAGRRTYGAAHLSRLNFIRHARDLGFEPEAIREMLGLAGTPGNSCARVDAIARQHLDDVEDKIARLELLRTELKRMIGACKRGRVADCRIIDTLADHTRCATDHGAPSSPHPPRRDG
jgi:DNA-binding transcriptional MerR regulator